MSSILNTYNRKKINFTKGKGSFLYSKSGKKYLDFIQGIAVNCLGHANDYLIKSIYKQSKKLWHISNVFTIPEQERLAKRLTQKTFADFVAFQNSGAEATEAAIKFARRYFYSKGQPKKNRVLCINNSFHGRTIATIFASNSKKATEGFGPKADGFDHFNFGDHKGLEKAITSRTAAIMVETIMGEGGIKVIPDYCLKGLRKLCNKKNILLILDEVQCGIGRSGKFFAFEHAKIKPDIVPIAKGIGGGFPIGAVLVNKKVASGMKPGTHGSTFGGNPLAMSAGNAVMDIMFKKGFLGNVTKNGKYFLSELNKLKEKYPKIIKEVRGKGLLLGLCLYKDQTNFIKKLLDNKLLTVRAAENVVRLLPPLNVTKKEINLGLKIIDNVCKKYK
ncbi:aspartate aminotransferase family protein [Candidatus Pelagibacter bacterium]|nr:aspartate aminotransferase family protein [Pelagibacteraceae bacterium]MDA8676506.1 aspartate aminotransferase family protein [Candidatus Pelagibacter bacterium]MDC1125113.1 aspartate aminotransferase family protein [Pelagibacteraceae bacterium]